MKVHTAIVVAAASILLPASAYGATCPSLSRGSTGSAVSAVQQILFDAYAGFPSPTGYFGPTTEAAVKQWQKEHGIEQLGIVGPQTAAAMKIHLCQSDSASQGSTSATSTIVTNQSLIQVLLAQVKLLQEKLAALLGTGVQSATSSAAASSSNAGGVIPSGGSGGGSGAAADGITDPVRPTPGPISAAPDPGTYARGQAVVLTSSGATSIHFTVNGTAPTCSTGYVYGSNGANYMYVGSTMTISAIACNDSGASSISTLAYTITPQGPCDAGWTLVPGNGRLGTGNFCVMQFQAQNPLGWMENLKQSGDITCTANPGPSETYCTASARVLSQKPISEYSGSSLRYAWNYITAPQAAAACQSIGAKLMDIPHAQTINLNIAEQPKNWQSGTVGQGCLFGGNMDGNFWDTNEPVPAPHGDDATADPFEFLQLDASAIAAKTPTCPFPVIGSGARGGYAERRSFYLSNGGIVWDWSGNLGEWLANILPNNASGATSTFTSQNGNGLGYWDSNALAEGTANNAYTDWTKTYLSDMERPWIGPYDPAVPALASIGRVNGAGGYIGPTAPGNGAYRGGSYYKGYDAGIFHIDIGHPATFSNVQIGFRCYKDVGTQPPPLFLSALVGN